MMTWLKAAWLDVLVVFLGIMAIGGIGALLAIAWFF